MAMAAVQIEGLREVNFALKFIDKGEARAIRQEFAQAAQPVADSAESLALANIRNMGPDWARMRVGVTTREVYVAPASRRRRGTARPNVGRLLFERAMLPALKKHEKELVGRVGHALDNLGRRAGF
jgi:hypothetical protein